MRIISFIDRPDVIKKYSSASHHVQVIVVKTVMQWLICLDRDSSMLRRSDQVISIDCQLVRRYSSEQRKMDV